MSVAGSARRSSVPPHLPVGSTEGEDRALEEPPLLDWLGGEPRMWNLDGLVRNRKEEKQLVGNGTGVWVGAPRQS